MAGRQSTSLVNWIKLADPIEFRKDGAQTVAAVPGSWTNGSEAPLQVSRVALRAGTAPTGAALEVDLRVNGTSVYTNASDRPRIAAGQTASSGTFTATKADLAAAALLPGQTLTAHVTQVGSTVAGSDLTIQVYVGGHRA